MVNANYSTSAIKVGVTDSIFTCCKFMQALWKGMVNLRGSASILLPCGWGQIKLSHNQNSWAMYLYVLCKFVKSFQQLEILGLIVSINDLTNPSCLHRINQELTLSYHFFSHCFLSLQALSAIQMDDSEIDRPLATKQVA